LREPFHCVRNIDGRASGPADVLIAFVQACWHKEIVDRCRTAFAAEIAKLGYGGDHVDYFEVPGSFEIPLHAMLLARSGLYAAKPGCLSFPRC
jgi:6,7-dimethyl-8-ribityllumazine synthase